ncbi:MAG TPA: type II secretion system protein [Terriglobales bacterium]|nr:type II secretion system protein [Terriglobales bacterium]
MPRQLRHSRASRSQGFTLLELLVVVAILTAVLGVVFTAVTRLQKTYKAEETKVDATQLSRTFLDTMASELRQAGFPSRRLFAPGVLGNPALNDFRCAAGLVRISASELWFEADIEGDGQVESVRYTLTDANGTPVTAASSCPCNLWRSQVVKVTGAPNGQAVNYNSSVDRVINSAGVGGGGAALAVAGTTRFSGGTTANDQLYAAYKTAPLFAAFGQSGNALALPLDLTANPAALAQVRAVTITLNVLASAADPQTGMTPAQSMSASARLNNF